MSPWQIWSTLNCKNGKKTALLEWRNRRSTSTTRGVQVKSSIVHAWPEKYAYCKCIICYLERFKDQRGLMWSLWGGRRRWRGGTVRGGHGTETIRSCHSYVLWPYRSSWLLSKQHSCNTEIRQKNKVKTNEHDFIGTHCMSSARWNLNALTTLYPKE